MLVIQKVKGEQLLVRREKWAPANSASCTSSYCRPCISISFVIAFEALQLPIQKVCAEGHTIFILATVLPPSQGILRHLANMSVSSCSLWPVLLSQQKPKLCFRQLPACPVLPEEAENIILLNKLFCKCCPGNLCGNFTGECFAQHGVHQHSQPHAGSSGRREDFKLKKTVVAVKPEAPGSTFRTKRDIQNNSPGSHQLYSFDSSDISLGSTGTLPALYLLSPFRSCKCLGLGRKKRSQHLFQAAMCQARGAGCRAILTDPDAFARDRSCLQRSCWWNSQTHAAHEATQPRSLSPQPSAKPQPDQTCKGDFVLYTKGWQLGRIWTEKKMDCIAKLQ